MLAVDERHGTLSQTRRLAFALAGAELVDLAQARRIVATLDARVKVTESLGTGDPVLDATLGVLSSSDDGLPLEDVVAIHLPGGVARQVTALLGSSELSGREMTTNLGGQPIYSGLRLTDPARRRELIKRSADVAEGEAGLTLEAFGALAHISRPEFNGTAAGPPARPPEAGESRRPVRRHVALPARLPVRVCA